MYKISYVDTYNGVFSALKKERELINTTLYINLAA